MYLFIKDPFESMYQLLSTEEKKYSQTTDDVYENLEDHNPTKNRNVLIVFDDMKADMEANKK